MRKEKGVKVGDKIVVEVFCRRGNICGYYGKRDQKRVVFEGSRGALKNSGLCHGQFTRVVVTSIHREYLKGRLVERKSFSKI